MQQGKQICKILKEIRQRIAEANDIELVTSECHYRGDCLGTCPKCEEEVRYLESQLEARKLADKAVSLSCVSAEEFFGYFSLSVPKCERMERNDVLTGDIISGYPVSDLLEDEEDIEF